MTRITAPWLLLVLTACAHANAACTDSFLGRQSTWGAPRYDGPAPTLSSQYSKSRRFSPIESLMVIDGQLHIATWGSEPMQSRAELQGGQIRVHPTFLARVGVHSELTDIATEVADFSRSDRTYSLQLVGGCRKPSELVVRIIDGEQKQIGSVALTPTR